MKVRIHNTVVSITQWTKRPKANGIYIMAENPVSDDFIYAMKEAIETSMNINVHDFVFFEKSRGVRIDEKDAKFISPYMVVKALQEI